MNETKRLQFTIYKFTLLLAIIVAIVALFIVKDYKEFILGLIFGTLIALLNLSLLAKTMEKAVHMRPETAKNYVSMHYFLRYIIYGVVLFIAIKADYLNELATIIGIISVKIVIYALRLFDDKQYYVNIIKHKK